MSFFKKTFVILAMVGLMLPSFALAADFGLKDASQGTGLIKAGSNVSENTIPELIGDIVGVALSFVGAIFFLLILYAGFLWMTAFGSSEKVEKAKDILLHAVIGLIIVLAAYAISSFVFGALTGEAESPTSTFTPDANVVCPPLSESNCNDPRLVDSTGTALCVWIESDGGDSCAAN